MGLIKAPHITVRGFEEGCDLLSHLVAVPSALTGLTSLFGMVRGGPRRHGHLSLVVKPLASRNIVTYGIRRLLYIRANTDLSQGKAATKSK